MGALDSFYNTFKDFGGTNLPGTNPANPNGAQPEPSIFGLGGNANNSLTGLGAGGLSPQISPNQSFLESLNLFGKDGNPGNLGSILGGLGGLASAWNGYNQLNLGEEMFDFQKDSFNRNVGNESKLVNAQLEDRQRARIGGTGDNNAGGEYLSLADYKTKHSVDGSPIG